MAGMAGADAEKVQQALVGVIAAVGALATPPADRSGAPCMEVVHPDMVQCGGPYYQVGAPATPPADRERACEAGLCTQGVMGTEWPLDLLTIP